MTAKCIIICVTDDGRTLLNAGGPEVAQQYTQGAVDAGSLDEALQMAKDVLSEGETPQQEAAEPPGEDAKDGGNDQGEQDAAAPPGAEGMPMKTPEDQMAAGFKRAKKGY